jgi:hypothetical protein
MQEITLAVISVCQANKECFASFHAILVSLPPLLLGIFYREKATPMLSNNRVLTKVALQGLVLNCSPGSWSY